MIPLKTNGMSDQITNNSAALRLFFTDDIYLLKEDTGAALPMAELPTTKAEPVVTAEIPDLISIPEPLETVAEKPVEEEPISFRFVGKNLRNILILVHDVENDVSTDVGKELLRNIVKAIGLTGNDFALLNYAGYPRTTFSQLKASLNSSTLFSFGVTPEQLGLPVMAQHTVVQHEGVKMIFSNDLHQLSSDQLGKKTLWGSLKLMNL